MNYRVRSLSHLARKGKESKEGESGQGQISGGIASRSQKYQAGDERERKEIERRRRQASGVTALGAQNHQAGRRTGEEEGRLGQTS